MQIRSAHLEFLEVPFRRPVTTAAGRWTRRRLAFVRLLGEAGFEGVGEVATDSPEGLAETIPASVIADLAGLDVTADAALSGRLDQYDAGPSWGRALRSAVETAALDLVARAAQCSLAAWLMGSPRRMIAVNGLIGSGPPKAMARSARELVAAGFGTLKLKARDEAPEALATRLRTIRSAVGPEIRLRLDMNGAWTEEFQALAGLQAIVPFGIEYVEQPLHPALGATALGELRRRVPVPVAADESVTGLTAARALLEAGAVDVLVVKPARVGGVGQAHAIVRMASEFGVQCVLSTFFETGLGLAASLHVAATTSGHHAHGLATAALLERDLLQMPLAMRGGSMVLPDGAGLGVQLDPVAVAAYRAR